MKFIAGLRVWVNGGLGKTPQIFPRFRGSTNRRVDLQLPLISFNSRPTMGGMHAGAWRPQRGTGGIRKLVAIVKDATLRDLEGRLNSAYLGLSIPVAGRVAGEHCCSPAPSERHVNLSVYAAQASLKVPRGTPWGAGAPPARYCADFRGRRTCLFRTQLSLRTAGFFPVFSGL